MSGFLISERYLASIQPLSFITPILIAAVGSLAEEKIGYARVPLLTSTVGAGAVVHLITGYVTGQLCFSYVLLVALYSVIGVAALQFLLKSGDKVSALFYSY